MPLFKQPIDLQRPTIAAPRVGELVQFYAQLAEPVDHAAIDKFCNAVDQVQNIFIEMRDPNGRLAGFLRAWRDNLSGGKSHGIIYEILVHPDFRRRGVGRKLRSCVFEYAEKNLDMERSNWVGNPDRVSGGVDRDLSVVRTIYGLSLSFGFGKVVESLYFGFVPNADHPFVSAIGDRYLMRFLAVIIAVLGVRMFWAVGNIRRYILQKIVRVDSPSTKLLIFLHLPILLSHAVLFYFLCYLYADICKFGLGEHYTLVFIRVYTILLGLNVIWLFLLMAKRKDQGPETLWIYNNACFVVIVIASLLVLRHYGVRAQFQLVIAGSLFLLNSILDFWYARGGYIMRDAFGGG